jgi:hypothetical protein
MAVVVRHRVDVVLTNDDQRREVASELHGDFPRSE